MSATCTSVRRRSAGPGPFSSVLAALAVAGCAARSGAPAATSAALQRAPGAVVSGSAPAPDPRVELKAGWWDAGEAAWNLRLVSNTRPSSAFTEPTSPGDRRLTNSDLAFSGRYVWQGNYSGYQVWDVADPAKPTLAVAYVCPGSQSDVTVYKNLLFVSAEATSGRTDCGINGVPDTASPARARGIRIFDITDVRKPKPLTVVQTCRGSHTNTLVTDPRDPAHVYIYVSGAAPVRPDAELPGCVDAPDDPNTALFRIEVIQVPLAHPEQARIVSSPRIFTGLSEAPRHAEAASDAEEAAARRAAAGVPARQRPRGITQCHDITTYPEVGLAGGACLGLGLILDIRDVKNPVRISAIADSNFSAWHSATFSNDGRRILFSDEWGGGSNPRCRATDNRAWGADAIYTIGDGREQRFEGYYKLPAPQGRFENCVSHNGSLIPVPGREIMVQAWYQGGISVFDWTEGRAPIEIAYFDRGPMDATKLVNAGHWSAYWWNGYIYGSEEARGLDIWELLPSPLLTKNELEAAKLVRFAEFNAQMQPKHVWPPAFVVARAYLDQLIRGDGLPKARTAAVAATLNAAERQSGAARAQTLRKLATELSADAPVARDRTRVRAMVEVIEALAKAE